jgi:hypothetical protein
MELIKRVIKTSEKNRYDLMSFSINNELRMTIRFSNNPSTNNKSPSEMLLNLTCEETEKLRRFLRVIL